MNIDKKELMLKGTISSPGIAFGPAFLYLPEKLEVPRYIVPDAELENEHKRLDEAVKKTRAEIVHLQTEIAERLGEEDARIFEAHLWFLEDHSLREEIEHELEKTKLNIDFCFHRVITRHINAFKLIDDDFIQERSIDINDVARRLLTHLLGNHPSNTPRLDEPVVLVTKDLTPSDTATLDPEKILGIVCDSGGPTSHPVIMARSIGIPAVVSLHNLTKRIEAGELILVDGYKGIAFINPSKKTQEEYDALKKKRQQLSAKFTAQLHLPTETEDKRPLSLKANIGNLKDAIHANEMDADGVGLFRTEEVNLSQKGFSSEEEQFVIYRKIVETVGNRGVIFRTFDLGGDKVLPKEHKSPLEKNPFMGLRGIRFCLSQKDIFKDQLRAILRASAFGKVEIMYPMISGVEELIASNEILEECKMALRKKGIPYAQKIPIGAMIEIPSAACIIDLLAKECDFFSIGTNDLIQYLLAVDRDNDFVAHLYMPHHPAVIKMVQQIIQTGKKYNLPVSICGEMASDPLFAPLLWGMGASSLSISPNGLPEAKYLLRRMKFSEAVQLTEKVSSCDKPEKILDQLHTFYNEKLGKSLIDK